MLSVLSDMHTFVYVCIWVNVSINLKNNYEIQSKNNKNHESNCKSMRHCFNSLYISYPWAANSSDIVIINNLIIITRKQQGDEVFSKCRKPTMGRTMCQAQRMNVL